MDFIDKEIENYALEHSQAESDVLKKLNRETFAKVIQPRMLSGHMQGNLLSILSKMIQGIQQFALHKVCKKVEKYILLISTKS
jgi:hypothetical protein